jgi:hypothetical protein
MCKSIFQRVWIPFVMAAISGLSALPAYAYTPLQAHIAITLSAKNVDQVVSAGITSMEESS